MAFDKENYYRLDYIQSNGNQYINPGFNLGSFSSTRGYRYEADVLFPTLPTTAQNYMGVLYSDGSLLYTTRFLRKTSGNNLGYTFRATSISTGIYAQVDTKYHCEGIFFGGSSGQSLTITDGTNTGTGSGTGSGYTVSARMYIFGENNQGTLTKASAMRMYYMKLWRTVSGVETLIRDFVPAKRKSDDMTGLYDVENEVFYARSGSGQFTYGKIIGESSIYIKNDGVWQQGTPFVKAEGNAKEGTAYIKVNGVWKEGV